MAAYRFERVYLEKLDWAQFDYPGRGRNIQHLATEGQDTIAPSRDAGLAPGSAIGQFAPVPAVGSGTGRDYRLSIIAREAYSDDPGNVGGFIRLENGALGSGGFFAVAYVNPDDANDIVIAFRGTRPTDSDDLAADLAILGSDDNGSTDLDIDWHGQFSQAINFVAQILARHPAASVSVTGHSLGGSLAQVAAYMFGLDGATFDPGGALNLVRSQEFADAAQAFRASPPRPDMRIGEGASSSFTNYFMQGSPVSGLSGEHVNDSNSNTLDFFTYAEEERVTIAVATGALEFIVGGLGARGLATGIVSLVTAIAIHDMDFMVTLMSIEAGGQFDSSTPIYQIASNATRYATETGSVGLTGGQYDVFSPVHTGSELSGLLIADNGSNTIFDTGRDDRIFALAGDDIIHIRGGRDTIDGGAGSDLVIFHLTQAAYDITVNLRTGEFTGGAIFDVEFVGGSFGTGNDTVVVSGPLFSSINGFAGTDRLVLDYSSASTVERIWFLADNIGRFDLGIFSVGGLGYIIVDSFEHLDITGTNGDDRFESTWAESVRFFGLGGNDTISGSVGADVLDGGSGDDTFSGVGYGDIVEGGAGIDSITLDLTVETRDITVNLRTGEFTGGVMNGVEFIGGALGSGNDTVIVGGPMFASISGYGGTDTLVLDYAAATNVERIWFLGSSATGRYDLGNFGAGLNYITIDSFENLEITGTSGDDRFESTWAQSVRFFGLGGNDTMSGSIGADVLDGGSGDDTFTRVGYGDIVEGGAGTDTVTLDLTAETRDITVNLRTGEFTGGVMNGVEFIGGALGSGNDTVIVRGPIFANISGNSGADTLVLDYSDAANVERIWLLRNSSNGRFDLGYWVGGGINYITVDSFENLDITGTNGDDRLDSAWAESVRFFGLGGNDTLSGSINSDVLDGGNGNDDLSAADGVDLLVGGLGNDMIDGGSNVDTAVVRGLRSAYTITQTATGVFRVVGPDGTDTLTAVEFLQLDDQTLRLRPGTGVSVNFETANPVVYQSAMNAIRDFDGNALGGNGSWLRIGSADVNGDGDVDQILVNRAIGRFATVGTAPDGLVYFSDFSWAGETRVAGIYIDPLVAAGIVERFGPNDSQRRFQNDLQIENINRVLGANDYDRDGLQEVYFALTDGTAYLRALMEADGNIRYANYQSQQEVIDYLTANGFGQETWGTWFNRSSDGEASLMQASLVQERVDFAEANGLGRAQLVAFDSAMPGTINPATLAFNAPALDDHMRAEFYG